MKTTLSKAEKKAFSNLNLLDDGRELKRKQIKQKMSDLMMEMLSHYKTMDDQIGYYTGKKKFSTNKLQKRYDNAKSEKTFLNILSNLSKKNRGLRKEYLVLEGLLIN